MKLVDNWRQAHKMFSVQAMTAAAAIQGAWTTLPEDMKSAIPPALVHWLTIALLVAGIGGRLISQDSTQGSDNGHD